MSSHAVVSKQCANIAPRNLDHLLAIEINNSNTYDAYCSESVLRGVVVPSFFSLYSAESKGAHFGKNYGFDAARECAYIDKHCLAAAVQPTKVVVNDGLFDYYFLSYP